MNSEQRPPSASAPSGSPLLIPSENVLLQIRESSGEITRSVLARINKELGFFAGLDAKHRAQIGSIVQSVVRYFAEWARMPSPTPGDFFPLSDSPTVNLVEGLSLQQLVAVLHSAVRIVEEESYTFVVPSEERPALLASVLRYSRELGFAAATYFAATTEKRGAWEMRMESALVDAIVRGEKEEGIRSFGSALAWDASQPVTVMVGSPPATMVSHQHLVATIHVAAASIHLRALAAVQGDYVVIVVNAPVHTVVDQGAPFFTVLGEAQVMVGPSCSCLAEASQAASEAFSALRVAEGMPNTPAVATADMFIPERAIAGDTHAIERLFRDIVLPLRASANDAIRETLRLYLSVDGGVEECARQLYVHPNTVRYRLKRVNSITGMDPLDSRMRFSLRIANILGMLEDIN